MNFVFVCVDISFAVSLAVVSNNGVVSHRILRVFDVVKVENSFFDNGLKLEIEFFTYLHISNKLYFFS